MASLVGNARRVYTFLERGLDSVPGLVRRSPQPLVLRASTFGEYQVVARKVSEYNSLWLEKRWFRDPTPPPSSLRGYCSICHAWTRFQVDSTVCSTWRGRSVPWWSNTLCCVRCSLPARMRAAVHLFESHVKTRPGQLIYITEQATSLFQRLRRLHPDLIGSEYIVDSTPRGSANAAGIRCEDLTCLTFPDGHFDHLLSFEVLEHIPDYQAALRECARVIAPGGTMFITVPFHGTERHEIRARLREDGSIEHLLPPQYHGDPLNPAGVLCYRDFGFELVQELRSAGFSTASAWIYWSAELGYLGDDRVVFVAVR